MADIMHADAARTLTRSHRNELNNKKVEIYLKAIMEKIAKAAMSGEFCVRYPFRDLTEEFFGVDHEVRKMLITRLRELGYEYEDNIGEDGPNRPGHDEIRWKE